METAAAPNARWSRASPAPGIRRCAFRRSPVPRARTAACARQARPAAAPATQLGNPLATDSYALCLYDLSGTRPALLFRAMAPAGGTCGGRSCWRAHGSGGFSYVDPDRTPDGIARIGLHAGPAGKP